MLTHFFKKENKLRLVMPEKLLSAIGKTFSIGFSVFFIDLAMGIMTMLYNKQILNLLSSDALSVFGAIASLTTVVQCCSYSIGQAAQPILSANFGANRMDRVRQVLRYGVLMSVAFGEFWAFMTMAFPTLIVRIFIDATDNVLAIAPGILRKYCIGYLFAPFTLFATYYSQSARLAGRLPLPRADRGRRNAVSAAAAFRRRQSLVCNARCRDFRRRRHRAADAQVHKGACLIPSVPGKRFAGHPRFFHHWFFPLFQRRLSS